MSGTSPGRGVVVAYVAAVVLSVLGMHALDQHCPIEVSGDTHGVMHAVEGAAAAGMTALSSPAAPMPDGAMICAAMLLACLAGIALASLVADLLRRRSPEPRAGPWAVRSPRRTRHSTGPPTTLAFVVIRC